MNDDGSSIIIDAQTSRLLMTEQHPRLADIATIALRSAFAAVLTVGAGWILVLLLGVTWISAGLFALACGLVTLVVSKLNWPGR
jgi:hypothetical protein